MKNTERAAPHAAVPEAGELPRRIVRFGANGHARVIEIDSELSQGSRQQHNSRRMMQLLSISNFFEPTASIRTAAIENFPRCW
jgi:hypothetical protein